MSRSLAIVSLSLLVGLAWSGNSSAQDEVFGAKGTAKRGTITTITKDQIGMTEKGVPQNFPVKEIMKVRFAAEPNELRVARDKALAGQYEDAVENLDKIDASKLPAEGIKQDYDYYKAYCAAKLSLGEDAEKQKAAAAAMISFVKDNRDSYHFYEASQILGDLAAALGNYDRAATFYAELAKAPWPDYQQKATVLGAQTLMAAGKYPEALAKFEQVLNSSAATGDTAEHKLDATIGKAQCLAGTGKPAEGIKMLKELIDSQESTEVRLFGRAYNALGACYVRAGNNKEALWAYLRTDLIFNSDPETHAEALYRLTKLWTDEKQPDRAKRARETLQGDYGSSRWANMK